MAKVYLNVDIICGECSGLMTPMFELWPKRIVYCQNEKCKMFHKALQIKPIEVETVEAKDILVEC